LKTFNFKIEKRKTKKRKKGIKNNLKIAASLNE
jgi:hypothetical protein